MKGGRGVNGSSVENIKEWIKAIRHSTHYHELDTIEHVITPILREIGFDVDNYKQVKFVRDCRNNNGSQKHHWDLNLFDGNDIENPEIVIEAKTARTRFAEKKWTNSSNQWHPKFLNTLAFQALREECGLRAEEIRGRKNNIKVSLETIRSRRGEVIGRLTDSSRVEQLVGVQGLHDLDIKTHLEELKNVLRSGNAAEANWRECTCKEVRYLLNLACSEQYNPTDDWIGQVWRYCLDGKHLFKRGKTIPILTNGAEWVVFRRRFYDPTEYPIVNWLEEKECLSNDEVLFYFDVESEDMIMKLGEYIRNARKELETEQGR